MENLGPVELTDQKSKQTRRRLVGLLKSFLTLLMWLIIWPIFMGIVAMGILAGFSSYITSSGSIDLSSGTISRLLMLLFVIIMVIICLAFIAIQKRSKKSFSKKGGIVLTVYMWLGILLGGVIIASMSDPQYYSSDAGIDVQTSTLAIPNLQSNPEVVTALGQVGASDTDRIDTELVDDYDDRDEVIDGQAGYYRAYVDQFGNWSYGEMSIKRNSDQSEFLRTVAHEYLHHVWYKGLSEEVKRNLTSDLISMYGVHPRMQTRVTEYQDDQMLQPTELFSYYCTEVSDYYLTKYVRDQCNKHIDRGVLTYYW